jgi:dTDP-4-amino-4,6-dideoxygalactose transaminase
MIDKSILPANPGANYNARKNEIDDAVSSVLNGGWYILGKHVSSFEESFARYIGVSYGIGVANGTDALLLAIKACGFGPGDSIATVSHTAVATVSAIVQAGAQPVLLDVDESTFTMNPELLENTLHKHPELNIKAVIPVHLYGHPADMDSIMSIAKEFNLFVIEDCAQSHGASVEHRKVGSIGHLGAFSFYPTKNLSALGDGGAIVTDDQKLSDRIRMLRQYGWKERYISEIAGMNSRLDEIQAAILQVKLKYLDEDNARRGSIASIYYDKLSNSSLLLPQVRKGCRHVYHQFTIRCSRRDELKNFLAKEKIGTAILYPQPVHIQPGYQSLVLQGEGGLSVTEKICNELLCLPVFPELSDDDVSYICEKILQWQKRFK